MIKTPNVAGAFYPESKEEILMMIDDFFKNIKTKSKVNKLKAIVAPHAWYIYSGQVAAYSYQALKNNRKTIPKTFVIMAPSHYEYFDGVSVWLYDAFETPLGKLSVDKKIGERLIKDNPDYFSFVPAAYEQEHSVEVQLPFLQYIGTWPYKILPLIFGNVNPIEVGKILFNLSQKEDIFIIVSSDLSHFMRYDAAIQTDEITLTDFIHKETEKIINEWDACGIHPRLALNQIAIQAKRTPELLQYKNSGDTTGEKSRVVGYGSVIYR